MKGVSKSQVLGSRMQQWLPLRLGLSREMSVAFEAVVLLFPLEVRNRGVYRSYREYQHRLAVIDRLFRGRKQLSVLDVGAGAGVVPLVLGRIGWRAHAVDTWAEYDAEFDNQMGLRPDIMARLSSHAVDVKECDLNLQGLPYECDSFDLVTMFDVIEHLHESPRRVLQEVHRVLKQNGYLILTTPNIAALQNRVRMLLGRSIHFPIDIWYYSDPFFGHIREYTTTELTWMVSAAGFQPVSVIMSHAPHLNTQLKDGRWLKEFRINSIYQLLKACYLIITYLVPSLRYQITVVARKST